MEARGDEIDDPSEDELVYDGNSDDGGPFRPRFQNSDQSRREFAQKIEPAVNQLASDPM